MKGLMFLGLVGAAIYGALLLSYDYLIPRDQAENAFFGQRLGNPSDRQLHSWGTDLPSLASSNSQEAQLPSPRAAVRPPSTVPEASPSDARSEGTSRLNGPRSS